eukprot:363807-Chlamydomonas_euryale.AAC.11
MRPGRQTLSDSLRKGGPPGSPPNTNIGPKSIMHSLQSGPSSPNMGFSAHACLIISMKSHETLETHRKP